MTTKTHVTDRRVRPASTEWLRERAVDHKVGVDRVNGRTLTCTWDELADYWTKTGSKRAIELRATRATHVSWYLGHETPDSLKRKMREGCTKGLEDAEALLDRIDIDVTADAMLPVWATSVVGSTPCVGAFLAGSPLNMFRYEQQKDSTPARVFVDVAISSGVNAKLAKTRGIAVVAFALALARSRPVELYFVTGSRMSNGLLTGLIVRLGTTPIDMSRLLFSLTNVAAIREVGISIKRELYGGKADVWRPGIDGRMLDLTPADVHIKSMLMGEIGETQEEAAAWVQKQLDKYAAGELSAVEDHFGLDN